MNDSCQDDKIARRLPSLVQCCQRVLSANIDSISGFGEDMPHSLVKPILQGCSADNLLRLERETPHITDDNEEIWKDVCFRNYPLFADQNDQGEQSSDEPFSWRSEYFKLREAEARRLEEAGNRIRSQRLEAEELKKQRQVKFTDRVPPAKRPRLGWSNGSTPPKTLFQKTRAEASKLQKSVYGPPVSPPMPSSKGYRSSFRPPSAQLLPGAMASPITVTTVIHRRPSAPKLDDPPESSVRTTPSSMAAKNDLSTTVPAPQLEPVSPLKLPGASKKDPMAALFMPKHRAHSQRPNEAVPSHSVPFR